MTITPERLRDIINTLVVAAEHRVDELDELRNEAEFDDDTDAAVAYRVEAIDLEAALGDAREWLAAVQLPSAMASTPPATTEADAYILGWKACMAGEDGRYFRELADAERYARARCANTGRA
jgi:hypothetical protein